MVRAYVHEYHSFALIPNQNTIIARNRIGITQHAFVVNEHIRSPTDRVHHGGYFSNSSSQILLMAVNKGNLIKPLVYPQKQCITHISYESSQLFNLNFEFIPFIV